MNKDLLNTGKGFSPVKFEGAQPPRLAKPGGKFLSFLFTASTVAVGLNTYTNVDIFTAFKTGVNCYLRKLFVSAYNDTGVGTWKAASAQIQFSKTSGNLFSRGSLFTAGAGGAYQATQNLNYFITYYNMPHAIDFDAGMVIINSEDQMSLSMAFTDNFANLDPLRGRVLMVCETF
jgi:hypothetical protein